MHVPASASMHINPTSVEYAITYASPGTGRTKQGMDVNRAIGTSLSEECLTTFWQVQIRKALSASRTFLRSSAAVRLCIERNEGSLGDLSTLILLKRESQTALFSRIDCASLHV